MRCGFCWLATVCCAQWLDDNPAQAVTERKTHVVQAVKAVAKALRNTPAICRKSYIHPEVLLAYSDGRLAKLAGHCPAEALRRLLRQAR